MKGIYIEWLHPIVNSNELQETGKVAHTCYLVTTSEYKICISQVTVALSNNTSF